MHFKRLFVTQHPLCTFCCIRFYIHRDPAVFASQKKKKEETKKKGRRRNFDEMLHGRNQLFPMVLQQISAQCTKRNEDCRYAAGAVDIREKYSSCASVQ